MTTPVICFGDRRLEGSRSSVHAMELARREDALHEVGADLPAVESAASPREDSTQEHEVVVREADLAEHADAVAIVRILDSHARSSTSRGASLPAWMSRRLVRDLHARGDVVVLLASRSAVPVGVVVCMGERDTFGAGVLRVHDLAVTTDYAGDRFAVAMRLMKAADSFARTRHAAHRPVVSTSHRLPSNLYTPVGSDVLQGWDMFVGGSMTPETYLSALRSGVFLLGGADDRKWCGPTRRGVFPLDKTEWPSSVRRALRRPRFRVTIDQAFDDVVRACADRPGGQTWLADDVRAVESALHKRGFAHSVEVWNSDTNALVGGIFGVSLGAAFAGESMFHRETDASKIAFAALVERLRSARFQLFDVQLLTPHLSSLGCIDITRERYRQELAAAVDVPRSFRLD